MLRNAPASAAAMIPRIVPPIRMPVLYCADRILSKAFGEGFHAPSARTRWPLFAGLVLMTVLLGWLSARESAKARIREDPDELKDALKELGRALAESPCGRAFYRLVDWLNDRLTGEGK